jgi:uncharacterized protein DUF4389
VNATQTYPVRLEGELQPGLSRWLWLVKWLLAIPHYIVLAILWLTLIVLTIVAFFAIIFMGRYPRGIFDFNVGVLRWTWRVAFYSYGALGTDRYPPFTLDDVPDYPARLEVAYPERLSRGLVLVKWWLLAIPHYFVVAIFLGGGGYPASQIDDRVWGFGFGFETGLIFLLVFFAGVGLLFTERYPAGIYDFVLGLDRWVARVAAYVLLMRDEYPPFRLDAGGAEVAVAVPVEARVGPEVPLPPAEPAAAVERPGGTTGKVILIVVGVIAGIVALALLVGGCALVAIDQTQRDDDGFLMSPTQEFSTPTYAVVSESADLDTEGTEWALDAFLGTVRIRSESDRRVFVGIGPAAAVERYLDGVDQDVVTDLDSHGEPEYTRHAGATRPARPDTQRFWVGSATGSGEQTLEWDPKDGDWRAVVMNANATRGVAADLSIGAELDPVLWIGIGLLVVGGLFAAAAALSITAATRRRA